MNVKKLFLLGTVTLLLFQNQVNAYSEKTITEYTNGIVKVIEATEYEEDYVLNKYNKDIEFAGNKYTVSSVEREKTENNTEEKSKVLAEILNTNNEETIKAHFGSTYQYEDSDFSGTLNLNNIDVQVLDQGSYEVIDEKTFNFEGYYQNDLNNIEKEIQINNVTYYLINVNWNVDETENIDNQEVPQTYSGVMVYQTVLTRKNPNKYRVTVTYTGKVEKINPIYNYSIFYELVVEPVKEPEQEKTENEEYKKLIVSGLGLGAIILAILLKENVKVYNKTDKGYKLIGRYRVKKADDVINITNNYYKAKSNIYSIKLDEKTYNKLKDKTIYLQIKKYKKSIIVNKQYIEILM